MMKSHSDHPVMTYFSTTKHVVAPRVYWFLRAPIPEGTVTLREIAFMVGSNRISVSRALRLLRDLKLVQYKRVPRGIIIEEVSESL